MKTLHDSPYHAALSRIQAAAWLYLINKAVFTFLRLGSPAGARMNRKSLSDYTALRRAGLGARGPIGYRLSITEVAAFLRVILLRNRCFRIPIGRRQPLPVSWSPSFGSPSSAPGILRRLTP